MCHFKFIVLTFDFIYLTYISQQWDEPSYSVCSDLSLFQTGSAKHPKLAKWQVVQRAHSLTEILSKTPSGYNTHKASHGAEKLCDCVCVSDKSIHWKANKFEFKGVGVTTEFPNISIITSTHTSLHQEIKCHTLTSIKTSLETKKSQYTHPIHGVGTVLMGLNSYLRPHRKHLAQYPSTLTCSNSFLTYLTSYTGGVLHVNTRNKSVEFDPGSCYPFTFLGDRSAPKLWSESAEWHQPRLRTSNTGGWISHRNVKQMSCLRSLSRFALNEQWQVSKRFPKDIRSKSVYDEKTATVEFRQHFNLLFEPPITIM